MQLKPAITPRKIAVLLGIIAVCLAAQSLVVEYVQDRVAGGRVNQTFILVIDLFSVNAEQAIPTWYSAVNLLAASVVLWVIATAKRAGHDRYARHWTVLALGFMYLSIDESAAIHEVLADWVQETFQPTGYLAFGWQVVAVPLVIVVGVLYLRFVRHLPPHTRNGVILAGSLYVGGTLLLDAVSANQWDQDGAITFRYLAIGTLEELFEMLGVIVMIHALLVYAVEMRYSVLFHAPPPDPAAPTPQVSVRAALRSAMQRRAVIAGIGLVVALNLALVIWASRQTPTPRPDLDPAISVPVMLDQLVDANVVVTRMPGRFIDNPTAHQIVAGLLPQFEDVIVVTSVSTESSFALAADDLPFDRDRLATVLQANGEVQFMIFDTPAVKAIVAGSPGQ